MNRRFSMCSEWLRVNTGFRNTSEYFATLLLRHGPPPEPYRRSNFGPRMLGINDYTRWRDRVAIQLNEDLHHSIDPSHVMCEYMEYLSRIMSFVDRHHPVIVEANRERIKQGS